MKNQFEGREKDQMMDA